jgi:hypothetical protein
MTVSDEQIVEAMSKAYWRCEATMSHKIAMTSALAAARPLIEAQAREKALEEAAQIASDLWEPYTVAEPYRSGQLDMALHISSAIRNLIKEPRQ